jgi:hypothetical protein
MLRSASLARMVPLPRIRVANAGEESIGPYFTPPTIGISTQT